MLVTALVLLPNNYVCLIQDLVRIIFNVHEACNEYASKNEAYLKMCDYYDYYDFTSAFNFLQRPYLEQRRCELFGILPSLLTPQSTCQC